MMAAHLAARAALAAGLCPVPPEEDGTKKPIGRWKEFQARRPTIDEIDAWYGNCRSGVGVVCGAVSGGLEMLEFEGRAVDEGLLEDFEAAARPAGLGDVLAHIVGGYAERTPSGGIHLLYRCAEVGGNQKLARRPATDAELAENPDDKIKVLIETRGEGGYVIVAPTNGTVHPTGGIWELAHGSFDTIVTITAEERAQLHALARTFDTMPVVERPTSSCSRPHHDDLHGRRPGDDFNVRADWDRDVLGPHGWTPVFRQGQTTYWRRPGKGGQGWSASTNKTGNDTLIVFSSSTGFDCWDGASPAPSYSKFAVYAALNHGGDFEAAARDLATQGYGDQRHDVQQGDRQRRSNGAVQDDDEWPALDRVVFHGLAGKVVRALEPYTEADPAGLLLVFLAFFGNAVGAGPHAIADGCIHAARLFVALVGDTSRSRKGTTTSRIRSLFELADPTWAQERIMSGFGSGEAIVDEVRDPKMGTDKDGNPVVVDQGVSDKRLLVLEGEFARILAVANREGSTISAIIRDAWDYGRLAARARQQKSVATGAHVSFVVNITVEELRRRLSETEMANGLANRYLFACVRRSKLLPAGGQIGAAELHRLGNEVRQALQAARKLTRLERSEDAEQRWAEMYAEMANGPRGLLGAITARAEAQTLRLSAAYALLDGSAVIEKSHLEAAYALWRYCENSAAYIFGDALGDDIADRLLAAIKAEGAAGLDFTAQSKVFGRNVKAKRLAAARSELEQLGLIRTVAEETDGRPKMRSYANTKETKKTKEGGAR